MSPHRRSLAVGALSASLAALTLTLAVVLFWPAIFRFIAAPALAALVVVGLASMRFGREGERLAAGAAVVGLVASVNVVFGCVVMLHTPPGVAVPNDDLSMTALRFAQTGATVLAALVALVAWRLLAIKPEWSVFFTRLMAMGALLLLAFFSLCAIEGSARAPSFDRYFRSLPLFVRAPAQADLSSSAVTREPSMQRDVIPLGEVAIVRTCTTSANGSCTLGLTPQTLMLPALASSVQGASRSDAFVRADDELIVRLDESRGFYVVGLDRSPQAITLDPHTLHVSNLRAWTLRPAAAPPRAWNLLAFLGNALSLALLIASWRRRGPEPVEAVLREDGALVREGRALTGVAVSPGTPSGPVVVFGLREPGATHYRDDLPQTGARIEPGRLTDHHRRVLVRAGVWAGLAWSVAALAGAPLVAWTAGVILGAPAQPRHPVHAPREVRTIAGVQIEELATGFGEDLVAGQTAQLRYVGRLADGKVFDSTSERDRPFEFRYGGGQVIPGFELGMRGMRVGGRRRMTIPPELGYGSRGAGATIPPNATLWFEVELVGVRAAD
jgi:hypothetical protein